MRVYRNLHKKCYSVQYNRKVVSHEDNLLLFLPKFKVSEAGRQRVIREKRKNVHAVVEGTAIPWVQVGFDPDRFDKVMYNPYKYATFVRLSEHPTTLLTADIAWVTERGVYVPSRS